MSTGQLQPVKFQPGQFLNGSEYQGKNRWRLAQLIRWRNRFATPIGGWKKVSMVVAGTPVSFLTGAVRAMLTWRANNQARWAAMGTSQKLYAFDGGALSDITPAAFVTGNENASIGYGFGGGLYGAGTWGTARTGAGIALDPAFWSFDNWGEWLVAVANCDGRLFQWIPAGAIATAVTNAPTGCRSVVTTNERYVFALGASTTPDGITYTVNPRNVSWCDQQNITVWLPTLTNTAGSIPLDTPGIIIRGTRFAQDVLIWTDQDLHRSQYLGPPLVYGFKKMGSGCGLIGPNAICQSTDMVVWMSQNGFYSYQGFVRALESDVGDFVFANINRDQQAKVCAGHNSTFNEMWWWYPSGTSTECDSYVVYNYVDNWWGAGKMARSAWADAQVWPKPLAAQPILNSDGTTSGVIFQHEDGYLDDVATRSVFLESAPIELGNGDTTTWIERCYQDTSGALGVAQLTLRTRLAPNAVETTFGPYVLDDARGYTDTRAIGRETVFRIDQMPNKDSYWHLGDFRLQISQSSRR